MAGNEGTHYPLYYAHGPGVVDIDEKIEPNQVNYDLDNNKIITREEDFINPSSQMHGVKKRYSRNVNNKRGRIIR